MRIPRHLPKRNTRCRDLRNGRLAPKDAFVRMLELDENAVRKHIESEENRWD
jgi:hypothetical protein